ncbi:hypothetical protein MTR_2080s0010 [Medicago truncatula]|uniref:Uncharacterized protein n=1 Tax=Medicago truncatula TaxID=3880 RepID=A0A072TDL8_MEDTR|nr:hypothetical protein MTR_2080s0010 [Medicago truncatula]
MIRQVLRLKLIMGKLKMRFLGEKCQVPESTQFQFAKASSLLAKASSLFPELAIASRVARLTSCTESDSLV